MLQIGRDDGEVGGDDVVVLAKAGLSELLWQFLTLTGQDLLPLVVQLVDVDRYRVVDGLVVLPREDLGDDVFIRADLGGQF